MYSHEENGKELQWDLNLVCACMLVCARVNKDNYT